MSIFTASHEASYRKRLGYHSALLAGICSMVATFILIGHKSTQPVIAEALRQDELAMLEQVLPSSLYNNDLLRDKITVIDTSDSGDRRLVYVAKQNQLATGFAMPATGKGYSGDIKLIVGINAAGEIIGVRVIAHTETPGLGDKIEIARDPWILVFNGKSLSNTTKHEWAVKKDGGEIDQFSGATITPRAVVNAVHQALEFFLQNQAQFKATSGGSAASEKRIEPSENRIEPGSLSEKPGQTVSEVHHESS